MWSRKLAARHGILAAAAVVATGVACSEVAAARVGLLMFAWVAVAVAGALVAAAAGPARVRHERRGDAAAAIREASLRRSSRELLDADVLNADIDAVIPVRLDPPGADQGLDAAAFAAAVVAQMPDTKWVVTGPPGSGKSILLHRIAMAFNERASDMCAVVLPLATYDWTRQKLSAWLADEVATFAGARHEDVERLIVGGRLFFLLDGIDTVPDREILHQQDFPSGELPLFDRMFKRSLRPPRDPRKQLVSRLGKLPGFVTSVRSGVLSPDELMMLRSFPAARLCEIPEPVAVALLAARTGASGELAFTPALRHTIRRPLYLRLAAEVSGELGIPPAALHSPTDLESWLWDRFLDLKLADSENIELDWSAPMLRAWLTHYAAAAQTRDAVSFRRWPLLYGRRTRLALRVVKGAVSAALLVALALLFVRPGASALIAAPAFAVFLAAGEGAATRPMAPQRFGPFRFLNTARMQWQYAASFAGVGGLVGWVATSGWATVLRVQSDLATGTAVTVGVAMGALLGFIVPTLYELHYVDDAGLRQLRRKRTLVPTMESSTIIGVTGGMIVALALSVVFNSDRVFLAVPLCVLLAIVDTLGLPCAAIALWALQRRGPVRVETFLSIAEEVGLARSYGQLYFLDHDEMKRYLATGEAR